MKKIISLVLAIVLCVALAAPAFADNETETAEEVTQEVAEEVEEEVEEGTPAEEAGEETSGEEVEEETPAGPVEVESGGWDGVSYTLLSNGELTVSGSGKIPDKVFKERKDIKSVIIAEGITEIGESVFSYSGLTEVSIPSSVGKIGWSSFVCCSYLKSVSIAEGVTEIDKYAFQICGALTEVKLPRSVTAIGECAFDDCKALTATVYRTAGVQIEPDSFDDVAKLIVYVPEDWSGYHDIFGAKDCVYKTDLFGTHNLGSVSYTMLANGEMTVSGSGTIPNDAFKGSTQITSVIIGEGITGIGDSAFQGCSQITSVSIGGGVTGIGENAFQGCSSIASVSLPNTLSSIGIRAFSECSSLESIWLPDGVATLKDCAFEGCRKLSYAKLPAGLQTVGNAVFNNCGLTEVSIPGGVPVIGKSMFSGCPLEEVVIPSTVEEIGDNAFKNCRNLKDVFMAEGVTAIGDSAFADCVSLSEIGLPRSVTVINGNAFAGCTALTATIHRTTATQINNNAFNNVAELIVLVPKDWSGDRDGFNAKSVVYDKDEAGTADDPYTIPTPEKLARLAKEVTKGLDHAGEYFMLTESFYYDGAPIGALNTGIFKGSFDGDRHTLNVNINTGDACASLFPHTEDATIKNLEITGSISGTESVGGVVGLANRNTLIDNCHVAASVTGSSVNVGGIVGMLYGGSTVSNCRVDGTVSSDLFTVGGVVGWLHGDSRVINCVKTGETSGESAVGGIVGYALGTTAIINCASFGKVKASSGSCGGIVGIVKKTDFNEVTALKLYSCYANCIIDCNTDNGYICGRNEYTNASPVDAQHLYYVMTGEKTALGYYSPTAKPVTFINRAGILNDLNAFAAGYGDASLTAWSRVAASICPASCSFQLADVDTADYTADVSIKEVTLDYRTPEKDGVKATGEIWGNSDWKLRDSDGSCYIYVNVPENCSILSVTYHCGYKTTDGKGYPYIMDYTSSDISLNDRDCTVNIPADKIVREVRSYGITGVTVASSSQYVKSVTVRYCETSATASVLSEGNVWIVCAVAAAAVIAVGALVVVKKKNTAE